MFAACPPRRSVLQSLAAAACVVLLVGQRLPDPVLGQAEEIRARQTDVAQFEDLPDAMMPAVPELPTEGDLSFDPPPSIEGWTEDDLRPFDPTEIGEVLPSFDMPVYDEVMQPRTRGEGLDPAPLLPVPLDRPLPGATPRRGPAADITTDDTPDDLQQPLDPPSQQRRNRPSYSGNLDEEPVPFGSDESRGDTPRTDLPQVDPPRADPPPTFKRTPAQPTPAATDDFPPPPAQTAPQPIVRRALRLSDAPVGTESVRLAIDGDFLGTLFERTGCTSGPVNDVILGARVAGNQTTRTRTRLQLIPDAGTARMNLLLEGDLRGTTVGSTSQADVVTYATHRFLLEKPVAFDGQQFTTRSPGAYVWPQQQTTGAIARVGQRVPVVRRMASRIAYEEAQRRSPAAQQIAAGKLSNRVSQEFNTKADEGLAKLQDAWQTRALDLLRQFMLDPQAPRTRTTADQMVLALPTSTAVAESQPPVGWEASGEALTLAVHESAVNAALGRLGFENRELEQGDWSQLVSRVLPSATRANETMPDAVSLATLRLVESDPVEVRFTGGRVEVELRAVVSTALGESPPQRIVLPWRVGVTDDTTQLVPGDVEVEALGNETGAMAGLIRSGIETRFNNEVGPLTLPRTLTAPLGEDRTLPLTLSFFRSRDGWLVLGWRREKAEG